MTDLTELERLAKAATPGPWKWEGAIRVRDMAKVAERKFLFGNGEERDMVLWTHDDPLPEDAEFIAAANPATILALIERVRAAEAKWQPIETAPPESQP